MPISHPPRRAPPRRGAAPRTLICGLLFAPLYSVYPYMLAECWLRAQSTSLAGSVDLALQFAAHVNRNPLATSRILTAWLDRPDSGDRLTAAGESMRIRTPSPLLLDRLADLALHDPDDKVRAECMFSLGWLDANRLGELEPGGMLSAQP